MTGPGACTAWRLAIEIGEDAVDIGKKIHPHSTIGESIGMAAEGTHGSCTNVQLERRRVRLEATLKNPETTMQFGI